MEELVFSGHCKESHHQEVIFELDLQDCRTSTPKTGDETILGSGGENAPSCTMMKEPNVQRGR